MNLKLLLFGFSVHVVFFYSIFDIYFTSPLVHDMISYVNPLPPPAKRLVLFSADGLRADKLYELDSGYYSMTPYLRNIIEHLGAWGISHTRVPTESRPGHVAFIAGFYEDVSAITKGWKENPVEFDSVFNQSKYTWSWGSPDILPMFAKGSTGGHVFVHTYPGHNENFAGNELTKLDAWVFDNVRSFFENVSKHETEMLQSNGIIFFLHLLGLDTTGHIHKPHSQEYVKNLRVVDEGVKMIVDTIENFYNHDHLTTYLLTSDHGMTDWGSHGAGHPSETQTPIVLWGAGVNSPIHVDDRSKDGLSEAWKLENIRRVDVNQADICPLMSTLIGLPIPRQSVGTVPVDILNASLEFKSQSLHTNVNQVFEQYKIKEEEKRKSMLSFMFKPFRASSELNEDVTRIGYLVQGGNYELAINKSVPLISLILEGVLYYHRYDNAFLGFCIAISYLGWIVLIVEIILEEYTDLTSFLQLQQRGTSSGLSKFVALLSSFIVIFLLAAQHKSPMHYIYCLLPIVLWYVVSQRYFIIKRAFSYLKQNQMVKRSVLIFIIGIAGLEFLIFAFTHRQLISLILLSMAVWMLLNRTSYAIENLPFYWVFSSLLVSIFPFLPTIGLSSNYMLVYLSAICTFLAFIFFALKIFTDSKKLPNSDSDCILYSVQISLLIVSGVVVRWFEMERKVERTSPSSLYFHILSWIILASSFVLPLMGSTKIIQRLFSISLAFFSPYLLLSVAHESFFYLSFCLLMLYWVQLETGLSFRKLLRVDFKNHNIIQRKLKPSDIRCSFFFIFFLLTSFFGTGNIASVNSFDPTSILCFVTIFNPFIMGGLMLYKVLILFLLVSSCFYAIQVATNVPKQCFFLLVLLFSDYMALNFFFMVKDEGSWLEIGSSISHYVIVMSLILFLFLLLSICKFITETSLRWNSYSINKLRSE